MKRVSTNYVGRYFEQPKYYYVMMKLLSNAPAQTARGYVWSGKVSGKRNWTNILKLIVWNSLIN